MNLKTLTPEEFLLVAASAAKGSAGQKRFRDLLRGLKSASAVSQRLAFEFLALAARQLETGGDPSPAVYFAGSFGAPMAPDRLPEYLAHLERIALRCAELAFSKPPPANAKRLEAALRIGLRVIRELEEPRFRQITERLRASVSDTIRSAEFLLEVAEPYLPRLRRLLGDVRAFELESHKVMLSQRN
jgi:hypothetical protein